MVIGETNIIIPNIITLTYINNPGIVFGIGSGEFALAILCATILAIIFIIYLLKKAIKKNNTEKYPLALILGGALGNIVDRIFTIFQFSGYGGVLDFIQIGISEQIQYPWVFNFADIAITIGIILLIVNEFSRIKKNKYG